MRWLTNITKASISTLKINKRKKKKNGENYLIIKIPKIVIFQPHIFKDSF